MCSFTFTMIWNDLGATSFRMACVSVWGCWCVGASWRFVLLISAQVPTSQNCDQKAFQKTSDYSSCSRWITKTMSNSLPLPGSNPNGKANFQSASSRTYVSFTKWEIHVTQLPRFVVEKWRQPACSVVRSTSQEGCCINLTLGWFQTYTLALVRWVPYSIGRRRDFPKECFGHSVRYPCLNFLLFPIAP